MKPISCAGLLKALTNLYSRLWKIYGLFIFWINANEICKRMRLLLTESHSVYTQFERTVDRCVWKACWVSIKEKNSCEFVWSWFDDQSIFELSEASIFQDSFQKRAVTTAEWKRIAFFSMKDTMWKSHGKFWQANIAFGSWSLANRQQVTKKNVDMGFQRWP